jgi:hypothetical protein
VREIHVECYSGYRADERPLRFRLGENLLEVRELEDSWYSPAARFFRVRANDENIYVLRHDEPQDTWTLDAYRAVSSRSPSNPNVKGFE